MNIEPHDLTQNEADTLLDFMLTHGEYLHDKPEWDMDDICAITEAMADHYGTLEANRKQGATS